MGGIYDSIEEKTNISNIEKKNKKSVEIPIRYKVFFLFIGIILFFYQRLSVRQAEKDIPSLIKEQSYQVYFVLGALIDDERDIYEEIMYYNTCY
ncbi:hypothetical protein EZS27_028750 [termite gut metagenome]|uniref:Uncharacterized protein n=1 Tax=termite gut metagenome TaxID=433724 RepID=A0A5J4QL16_9ZZZZ